MVITKNLKSIGVTFYDETDRSLHKKFDKIDSSTINRMEFEKVNGRWCPKASDEWDEN